MTKLKGVFPQSRDLKEIIESHNWTLYDSPNAPPERAYTWEEMDQMTPADQYKVGHNYLFVPVPKNGQTLRQARTSTQGLLPSLFIADPDEDRWISLIVQRKVRGNVALFSRLFMESDFAVAGSPGNVYPHIDTVGISYEKLVDTFRRYFRIVSIEEYGLQTPIPIFQ